MTIMLCLMPSIRAASESEQCMSRQTDLGRKSLLIGFAEPRELLIADFKEENTYEHLYAHIIIQGTSHEAREKLFKQILEKTRPCKQLITKELLMHPFLSTLSNEDLMPERYSEIDKPVISFHSNLPSQQTINGTICRLSTLTTLFIPVTSQEEQSLCETYAQEVRKIMNEDNIKELMRRGGYEAVAKVIATNLPRLRAVLSYDIKDSEHRSRTALKASNI